MARRIAAPNGLNLHVYPSSLESASRLRKLAKSLQEGCEFEETHIVGMRKGGILDSEYIAPSVRVIRLAGTRRGGTLGRILKTLLWQPRVFFAYRRQNVAVIAAHNVWVLPLCARISVVTGASFVYNPHELETETVAMRGVKQRVARAIERRFAPRAHLVSTVNDSISRWYANEYELRRPIAVANVPEDDGSRSDLRRSLGLELDDMVFMHTGHLAEGRNIRLLLSTFAEMPTKHLILMGVGPLSSIVSEAAMSLDNVHWVLPVAPNAVVAQMRQVDVGICLIEDKSLSLRLSLPNKFYEALCAGTPSLITDLVEPRRVLGDLADTWTVSAERGALQEKVRALTRCDVDRFRANHPDVGSWDVQVAPLVRAYGNLLTRASGRRVARGRKQSRFKRKYGIRSL